MLEGSVRKVNEETLYQTTAIIDIDEQMRKEEEMLNTIKMEPILETTEIEEEPVTYKKQRRIRLIDYLLITMIGIISVVFLLVVLKVM